MTDDEIKTSAVKFTAALGLVLVVLALLLLLTPWMLSADHATQIKELFTAGVAGVMLPVFNATIATALTFIFGKPIANAIAARLANSRT